LSTWRIPNVIRGAALLAIVLVGLAVVIAPRPAAAQAPPEDGCDPSEQIACLPLPADEGTPAAGPEAPTTAAPRPPAPIPCPPALAAAEPGQAEIAAPLPPVPSCDRRAVVATVNRANVLYARALRALDTRDLPLAWGGEALNQVRGYVADLRAAGRYATPALRSIELQALRVDRNRAVVRTLENWLYEERDLFSGRPVVRDEQWVINDYELDRRGAGWVVVRNDVYGAPWPDPSAPIGSPPMSSPPAPPTAPSMPCILIFPRPPECDAAPPSPAPIDVSVSTDRDSYQIGETVTATVTNNGSSVVYSGGGDYPCGFVHLEFDTGQGWEPIPGGGVICATIARALQPGESHTESLPAGPEPGTYRLMVGVSGDGGGTATVHSKPFQVFP